MRFIIPIIFLAFIVSAIFLVPAHAHHMQKGTDYYAIKVKQVDESVSSSTTPQPDDELTVYLDDETRFYYFQLQLYALEGGSTAEIDYQFTAPTGAVVRINSGNWESNAMGVTVDGLALQQNLNTGTTERAMSLHGIVELDGTNKGDLTFNWAQRNSDASPTTVLKGSSLVVWKAGSGVAIWDDTVTNTTFKLMNGGMYANVDPNTAYFYKLMHDGSESGGDANVYHRLVIPSGEATHVDGVWDINSAGTMLDATVEAFNGLDGTQRTHETYGKIITGDTGGDVDFQFRQSTDIGITTVDGGSAFMLSESGTYTKVKTVDESLASSTVYQADDELYVDLEANKVYSFEFYPFMNSTFGTVNAKTNFYAPSGATVRVHDGIIDSTTLGLTEDGLTYDWFTVYGTAERTHNGFGKIEMGDTAGRFGIQWAQSVSDPDSLVMLKGSTLIVHEFEPISNPNENPARVNPDEVIVIKKVNEFREPRAGGGYTLQDGDEDAELKVWLEANRVYAFESRIFGESICNGCGFEQGMTWDYTVPDGAVVQGHFGDNSDWSAHYYKFADGNDIPSSFPMSTYAGFGEDEISTVEHTGKVVMGNTAGYLHFRWTPQNDQPDGFEVKRGSSFRVLDQGEGGVKLVDQTLTDHWEDFEADDAFFFSMTPNQVYAWEIRDFMTQETTSDDPMMSVSVPSDTLYRGHMGGITSDWSYHFLKFAIGNENAGWFPVYLDVENTSPERAKVLQQTGIIESGNEAGNFYWTWSDRNEGGYVTKHAGSSMRVYQDNGDNIRVKQTDESRDGTIEIFDGVPYPADSELIVPLEPNKLYTYEARIFVESSDGINDSFAYDWEIPNGAVLWEVGAGFQSSDISSHNGKQIASKDDGYSFPYTGLSGLGATDNGMIELHGVIDMQGVSQGGDLKFLWTSNDSGGTTELVAGSSLRVYQEYIDKKDTGTPSADPPTPNCEDSDLDFDFINDCIDQCPLEPENRNFFQDEDGCPDEDIPLIPVLNSHLFQAFGNTITTLPNSFIDNQNIMIQWNNPDNIIAQKVEMAPSPFDFTFETLPVIKKGSGLPLSQNNIAYNVKVPNTCNGTITNECVQLVRYEIPATVYGVINGTSVSDKTQIIIDLSDDAFDPILLLLWLLLLIPILGVLYRRRKKKAPYLARNALR